ncbi:Leucine-rich repeat-containing G-protein coupled receptor 4 [Eumeta japonica]|uniref:Leucine-rich repeat-containing G-protein coupled receptor 4 n=1 Tax=Eumeta variegata TaxID=151549 RepID=A0A4C1TFW9_EUMVA|nr:Leucine-rich repeat-containing G-protein coupled receptor 4 [Eumeta japonica]
MDTSGTRKDRWKWLLLATVLLLAQVKGDDGGDAICHSYHSDGKLHLDCSGRGLTALPEGLDVNAQIVDLSYNHFTTIPSDLIMFAQLEKLILNGNQLTNPLPRLEYNWQNLRTLNLSNNNFDKWTTSGLGANIETLDISANKITRIDLSAFADMHALVFIDLSRNRLRDLPHNIFSQNENLDTVILSHNNFSSVPEFESKSLRTLDLNNCQITTLRSDAFSGKTTLLDIDLSTNGIDYIPDDIASNTLQTLNLAYNDINSLNERTLSSLPQLAVLDLRGNNFREIWDTSFFSTNLLLREVHLEDNRWSCEGFGLNLLLTYEFLTREPPKVADRGSLICHSPSNVTRMSWQEAYIRTWHPSTTSETLTLTAVFIGMIIGVVFTGFVCRGLMAISSTENARPASAAVTQNRNGVPPIETRPRAESTQLRTPSSEDLPPTYDEALLMPRLNASFHSLPDYVEENERQPRMFRRSRSINDILETRPRSNLRHSVRATVRTVVIDID